ncbi:MAG: hypothetical protein AAB601_01155 [Patescibacteria group bacterium]
MAIASSIVGTIGLLGFGVAFAARTDLSAKAFAAADSVEISNDVRIEANAGGLRPVGSYDPEGNSGATVEPGRASVGVRIYGSVNGEELPPIEISTSSNDGSPRAVQFHSEYASGNASTEFSASETEPPVVSGVEPRPSFIFSVMHFLGALKVKLNNLFYYALRIF